MYKHKRNLIIGLLIMLFGVWLYAANELCCPFGQQLGIAIAGVGFGIVLVSVIEYDQLEALKEERGELNQK